MPARCRSSASSRWAPRTTRTCSTWRTWACGSGSGPTACRCCTARSAGRCSPGSGRGSTVDEVPITSVTNGVHAPTWMAREIIEIAEREVGSVALQTGAGWDGDRQGQRRRAVGRAARTAGPAGARDPPPRPRARRWQRGMAPAELGWTSSAFDPNVLTIGFARRVPSYKRLTLMLRDAERLKRAAAPSRAAGADRHRRQEPPGRRRRQAAHRADGPVRRRPGGAPPHHVPARLRHRHGPLPVLGRRRLAEQPAAAAGGVRHVGHEGGAQRRAEPLDPRRLVGRVVRRRERLGHPVGRRRRRPGPPRRPRGDRPVRPDRAPGRHPVL